MNVIIVNTKSREIFDNLMRLQARAESALLKVQELDDIPCSDISTLTKPTVNAYVKEKVREVGNSTFMTSTAKAELIAQWQKMNKVAVQSIGEIQAFVEACQPQATVCIKDGKLTTGMSLQEIADGKSLMEVPERAAEHYAKILSVREAIADLRSFEKEEDLKPMTLGTVSTIQEDEVASAWANGWIKRDHRFDNLLARASGTKSVSRKRNIIVGH